MKNSKRATAILYLLAGILFFIASIIGKNYVYIPIGCCFVCLGAVYGNKKNRSKDEKGGGDRKAGK